MQAANSFVAHWKKKISHKTNKQIGFCPTNNDPENHSDDDGHDHSAVV